MHRGGEDEDAFIVDQFVEVEYLIVDGGLRQRAVTLGPIDRMRSHGGVGFIVVFFKLIRPLGQRESVGKERRCRGFACQGLCPPLFRCACRWASCCPAGATSLRCQHNANKQASKQDERDR